MSRRNKTDGKGCWGDVIGKPFG